MPSLFLSRTICLPLKVDFVSWNFASLVVSGQAWALHIDSSWSLDRSGKSYCDEDDELAVERLQALTGLSLISVKESPTHEQKQAEFIFENEFSLRAWGDGEVHFGVK